jgi:hypothetical protein
MASDVADDLFSPITELGLMQLLLADLHDDLVGKVARFRQLSDLSMALGSSGTMLSGGETTYHAWAEARSSFVHGNFIATVMVCQGLAEHLLASHLSLSLTAEELPERITFRETLDRCLAGNVISEADAADLRRLMSLRNPLSHFRSIDDPSNLSRRVLDERQDAEEHLRRDATFAIGMAVRLLALPSFRLGN